MNQHFIDNHKEHLIKAVINFTLVKVFVNDTSDNIALLGSLVLGEAIHKHLVLGKPF